MSDIAIKVENLSKRYRIGLEEEVHDTLAGQLAAYVKSPLRNLRNLRRLTRFGENGQAPRQDPEDVIWALKDVSFEVQRGEVVGVIGRNGAGKSTLLKILSRITHPTSGRVVLNGRVSSLLEVGTGFHQELTGRENVYLNGTILGMRKAEVDRKFDEIVAFSGVEKFIDTPVKRYSSGMKVRLAFAVAAHLEPEILLIDEVLAVGDFEFQKKCLGKMRNIAQTGRTVLFVSHNMLAVRQLCSRGILFERGNVMVDGQTSEALSAYMLDEKALATSAKFNILDHMGSGEAKITCVRLLDEKEEENRHFQMGESVIIEFLVETEFPNLPLTHSVEILDSNGMPIFHLWDYDNSSSNRSVGKQRKVRALISDLDLFPDQYLVNLWIGTGTGFRVDRVENCLSFEVEQGESYRRHFSKHRGAVHRTARWEYHREE